jgi:VanZ family protein
MENEKKKVFRFFLCPFTTRHLIEFHITFRPTHVAISKVVSNYSEFFLGVVVVVCFVVEKFFGSVV